MMIEKAEEGFDIWEILSKALSLVLHPLSLPTVLFIVIYLYAPTLLSPWSDEGKMSIIGMIFFTTYIIPVILSFVYFYSSSKSFQFSNLFIRNHKERTRPFIMVGFVYAFLGYLLQNELKANYFIVGIIWIMAATIVASAFVSTLWKISIHAVAISGFTAFLFVLNERFAQGDLFYHILITILISGFLLSARLYLREHNFLQILAGWLLGMALTLTGMLYIIS